MKMQDLLMTNRVHTSKKDDSVLPDDDVAAVEPLTGTGASSNSPTAEADEDEGTPKQCDGISPARAVDSMKDELMTAGTGQPVLRIPAVGLMFADTLYGAPTLLPELVNRWGAVHKLLIILTVRQVMLPTRSLMEHSFYYDTSQCTAAIQRFKSIKFAFCIC